MRLGNSLASLINRLLQAKGAEPFDVFTARTEAEFDEAFDAWLEKCLDRLEGLADKYSQLDEVGLTGVLAGFLSMPKLSVTQETYSQGHVDLIISVDGSYPQRKKLGEAKIYHGPAYHYKGLKQLLGRYSSGREGRGLLIVYVRQKGISNLMGSLRESMDRDLPESQTGPATDHKIKWAFVSSHNHSCGSALQVSHVGCNQFVSHHSASSAEGN